MGRCSDGAIENCWQTVSVSRCEPSVSAFLVFTLMTELARVVRREDEDCFAFCFPWRLAVELLVSASCPVHLGELTRFPRGIASQAPNKPQLRQKLPTAVLRLVFQNASQWSTWVPAACPFHLGHAHVSCLGSCLAGFNQPTILLKTFESSPAACFP